MTKSRQEQALAMNAAARAHWGAIDRDPRLTPEAKRHDKAETYGILKQQLEQLHAEEINDRVQRTRNIERSLFGVPADATSQDILMMRDAQERASRINNHDIALREMRDSATRGDIQKARAIASHAVNHMWNDIATAYFTEIEPAKSGEWDEFVRGTPALTLADEGAFLPPVPDGFDKRWEVERAAANNIPPENAAAAQAARGQAFAQLMGQGVPTHEQ